MDRKQTHMYSKAKTELFQKREKCDRKLFEEIIPDNSEHNF